MTPEANSDKTIFHFDIPEHFGDVLFGAKDFVLMTFPGL